MLINDLVIKLTTMHTQPIAESTVNKEEDVRDEDLFSSAGSSTVGQTSCKATRTIDSF